MKSKICINGMAGNEEQVILRMLESCYKHIDYWVIQCNGDDNTQNIIEDFFAEKEIPGFTYNIEWRYPGWNRDHALQETLRANHGCDWILRMDADEKLDIEEEFDWSILDDTTVQSWNVTAEEPSSLYFRTWMWNAKLPWKFKHDKRHECILLPGAGETEEEFQRVALPRTFKHRVLNDGTTWVNPNKYIEDALEIEKQKVCNNTLLDDNYHFFYLGKSYIDCYQGDNYPLGIEHSFEFGRRAIFYLEQWVRHMDTNYAQTGKATHDHEMIYYALFSIGEVYNFMGENAREELKEDYWKHAIQFYNEAGKFCAERNEHLYGMARAWYNSGEKHAVTHTYPQAEIAFDKALKLTEKMLEPERKNPFPKWHFLLHSNLYHDSGTVIQEFNAKLYGILHPNNPKLDIKH